MEANAGLVKRLATVGVLAKIGKKLQAEQDVFAAVGAGLDFTVVVMMVVAISAISVIRMIHRPDGILPHGCIRRTPHTSSAPAGVRKAPVACCAVVIGRVVALTWSICSPAPVTVSNIASRRSVQRIRSSEGSTHGEVIIGLE